jgi:SpoVK/Ycf46/Vps4 family AAA+-type ATPase
LEVRVPERYLADMVVSDEVNRQIAVTLQEFQSRRILQTALLSPRHKLLFYGPPGCGKTALESLDQSISPPNRERFGLGT